MAIPEARPPGHEVSDIAEFLARHGVCGDARILDVPCGLGRRAFGLAERGYRVTAVDANAIGIDAARSRVPRRLRERLLFEALPREAWPGPGGPFAVVLCLDHALGRGSAGEDASFLTRLRASVAPGGLLVLEVLHRDFFTLRPKPFAFHVLGSMEQHEFRIFDPATGMLEFSWRFYERDGESLKHRAASSLRLRLLTPHEVRELCEDAGWRVEGVSGGWRDEPVKPERRHLVLAARVK